jgi:hypothetical protein
VDTLRRADLKIDSTTYTDETRPSSSSDIRSNRPCATPRRVADGRVTPYLNRSALVRVASARPGRLIPLRTTEPCPG